MIIQEKPVFLLSNERYLSLLLLTVFLLGSLALLSLTVGAFIFALYLLNLLIDSLTGFCQSLAAIYLQSDSFVKLLMWLIGIFLLYKVGCKAFPLLTLKR